MIVINPGSEDFFYWDPEKLEDYQKTECSERSVRRRDSSVVKPGADGSELLGSITAIIKNKGAV